MEKYAIEYGKSVDWFKKTIDGVWERLTHEEEDEDTEDDDSYEQISSEE